MIATLTKQPTNSFSLSARRYTDPWGVTRAGASTGKPDQWYCANLGHRQDDESGLTYMRTRYYEPTTGRFINEDPAMDGDNWFVYSSNAPTCRVDPSEKGDWYNETFFAAVMGLGDKALLKGAEMAVAEASRNKGAAAIAVLMAAAYSPMMIAAMLTLDDTIEASLLTRSIDL